METRSVMYGYYNRSDESNNNFVNKVDGLATAAGIIGLGVVSRPYLSKLAGKAAVGIARSMQGRLSGTTVDAALNDVFGEEFRLPFIEFAKDIRKQVGSTVARRERLNSFFDQLSSFVETSNKETYDKVKDEFRSMASIFGKIGDVEDSDYDNIILNSRAMAKLKAGMEERGVKFTEGFQRDYQRHFEEIASRTSRIKPDKKAIEDYLYNPENQKELQRAFDSFWEKQQKRVAITKKFIDLGPDYMEVTGKDLQGGGDIAQGVNKYLRKIGVDAQNSDNPAQEIVEKARDLHHRGEKSLFRAEKGAIENRGAEDSPLNKMFEEKMARTTTGLVYNKNTREVFSLARLRQERIHYSETLINELQIPLIPFKANVPLKVFRFMKPSHETIRNLGNVGLEPELRREFLKNGYSRKQLGQLQGLGLDDKLMTFSEEGSIKYHDKGFKRIVSYERRKNQNINSLLNARDQDPQYREYLKDFAGSTDSHSMYHRMAYNMSNKTAQIKYDPQKGGFLVDPRQSANAAQTALLRTLYKEGELVPTENIHPELLNDFLQSFNLNRGLLLNNMDPEQKLTLLHNTNNIARKVIEQAASERLDLSNLLTSMRDMIPGNSAFGKDIARLVDNIGNPETLKAIISDLSNNETFTREAAPELVRAVSTLSQNPMDIFDVSQGESGFANQLASDLLGQKGVGQGLEKLQEGILSQIIRDKAVDTLATKVLGGSSTSKDVVAALLAIRDNISSGKGSDILFNDALSGIKLATGGEGVLNEMFEGLGLLRTSTDTGYQYLGADTEEMINSLISRTTDKEEIITERTLGKLAATTMDSDTMTEILLTSSDVRFRSKMVQDIAEASKSLDFLNEPNEIAKMTQFSILSRLSGHLDTDAALKARFSTTRPFIPPESPLSPLNTNNYYTVTSEAPDLFSLLGAESPEEVFSAIGQQAKRLFGLPDLIGSLSMPDQALGSFGAAIQMLVTMPQHVASQIGLGISGQDRVTALRTVAGMYGKRVLPLVVANEVYKNYNSNMHSMGAPGLDDMAANILANINLTGATIKDSLGITSINQFAVGTLPGLDQYFSPRSREEYEEYLKYGNEEVRENRGWMYGSRSPLTGGRVKYVRPNFYRRYKSHWTEAENVDISNAKYSFLPNLENPFAPISLLLNPDFFQEKHRSDRPYLPGGIGTFSPGQTHETKDYLTINSGSNYGPLAIGEIGGGYPTAMTGGGYDVFYDKASDSLIQGTNVTGAQGTGGAYSGGNAGGNTGVPQIGAEMSTMVYAGNYQQHTFGLEGAGKPIRLGLHKAIPRDQLEGFSIPNMVGQLAGAVRKQAGVYGAILARSPLFPVEDAGLQEQDPNAARSFGRTAFMAEYGEFGVGGIGLAKEFFRRYIDQDVQGYDAYNPLPNNMPSWLPDKFKTGDPYMRTPGIGELQLPGDAYERTHPYIAPLRVRGSAIGLSEKELIQKFLNPLEEIEDQDSKDIVDFGSAVHLQIQRQLREAGQLVGAEVSIYDKENNFTGTIDAVVRGQEGMEILEVKTQGEKGWGTTPEKYIDQLNFYMATTGIHKGNLVFVNRDNPEQVRIQQYEFDPDRYANVVARVERARATVNSLVEKGMISPFETYDLVSRIEILAKVAPGSPEFRDHVEHAQQGGMGGFEKQRVEQAIAEAESQEEDYRLYNNKYGVDLETIRTKVLAVGRTGEILTDVGTLRLAGIKFDAQAFSFEDPNSLLAKYGIKEGENIKVQIMKGSLNPEVMNDVTTPVIIGNVNKQLVEDKFANWNDKETQRNPVASQARYGNQLIGGLFESLVHSDNLITNKFMRVRTPLEQFERGEVFGTDEFNIKDPIRTIVMPTLNSMVSKDPISAGVMGGITAAMFARTNSPMSKIPYLRNKMAFAGAVAGIALSTLRTFKELSTDGVYTPSSYRKQAAFDEYWDKISYLKYTAIAESAKKLAAQREGVNLDKMREGQREAVGLGPYSILAIDAERKAKRTMYGYDVMHGSLQDAIATLPGRQQQIAQEIVQSGTLEEKQRFYDLLPDSQRRVLGKFLGVDYNDLPEQQNLSKYFESHFLPNVDWAGWSTTTDLGDIKTRSAGLEEVSASKPSRARINKARARSNNIPIPRMDNPTYGNVRRQINNLLSSGGYHNISVNMRMVPADSSTVNVNMNLFDDQTDELIAEYRREGI